MATRNRHRRIPSNGSSGTAQTVLSTASTTISGAAQSQAPSNRMGSSQPASGVRRTLFHTHHSARRAISGSSVKGTNSATVGNSSTGSSFGRNTTSKLFSVTSHMASPVDNGDIVSRDQNGCYEVNIPILPPGMFGEDIDGDAMDGIEDVEGVHGSGIINEAELRRRENEKIHSSIVEMMRQNRNRQINGDPSEVLLLIQESLREGVAGLDDDVWMFESG
ncbi:hypothetical protein FQN57_001897 [Myotisia sp. PD_48]|nr:hypothetical protein FQN57_001897 [Myotisia sp. PD_48]